MAVTTSDKAVTDYLDNLLNDFPLDSVSMAPPKEDAEFTYVPMDSIDVTTRMIPLVDPFRLMLLKEQSSNQNLLWLGIHVLLPLCERLPQSSVKQYCLRQCQTLLNKAQRNTA